MTADDDVRTRYLSLAILTINRSIMIHLVVALELSAKRVGHQPFGQVAGQIRLALGEEAFQFSRAWKNLCAIGKFAR